MNLLLSVPADTIIFCLLAAFGVGMVVASALIPTRSESETRRRQLERFIETHRIEP